MTPLVEEALKAEKLAAEVAARTGEVVAAIAREAAAKAEEEKTAEAE